MRKQPTQLQYGLATNGSIRFNDFRAANRTISGACQIAISDSTNVSSPDTMTLSKSGQTGYISSKSITFLADEHPSLSISAGLCRVNNKLSIQDGANQTVFEQIGDKMVITGNVGSSSVSGASIYGDLIIGITGSFETIAGSAIHGNVISGASIYGTTIMGNTISGMTGNFETITGSTIYGNVISGASIYGNTISSMMGNFETITGLTIYGNVISGASIYGSIISGITGNFEIITGSAIYGNVISGESIYGNSVVVNTISGVTGNFETITGSTIYAGSLFGFNTITVNNQLATKKYVDDKVVYASNTVAASNISAVDIYAESMETTKLSVGVTGIISTGKNNCKWWIGCEWWYNLWRN